MECCSCCPFFCHYDKQTADPLLSPILSGDFAYSCGSGALASGDASSYKELLSARDLAKVTSFFNELTGSCSGQKPAISACRFADAFGITFNKNVWINLVKQISSDLEKSSICYEEFCSFVALSTRTAPHQGLNMLWMAARSEVRVAPDDDLASFLGTILEISGCTESNCDQLCTDLLARYKKWALNRGCFDITFATTIEWVDIAIPCAGDALQSYISGKIFPNSDYPLRYRAPMIFPQNSFGDAAQQSIISSGEAVVLALHTVGLQGEWKLLFRGPNDTTNTVAQALMGYDAPQVVFIRTVFEDRTCGAYSETAWTDQISMYGSSASFLFSLKPEIQIFDTLARFNHCYQYLNISNAEFPRGLGMGGTINKFRLFIDIALENCSTTEVCETFEPGFLILPPVPPCSARGSCKSTLRNDALLLLDDDEIYQCMAGIGLVEIWGTGGEECIQRGLAARAVYSVQLEE